MRYISVLLLVSAFLTCVLLGVLIGLDDIGNISSTSGLPSPALLSIDRVPSRRMTQMLGRGYAYNDSSLRDPSDGSSSNKDSHNGAGMPPPVIRPPSDLPPPSAVDDTEISLYDLFFETMEYRIAPWLFGSSSDTGNYIPGNKTPDFIKVKSQNVDPTEAVPSSMPAQGEGGWEDGVPLIDPTVFVPFLIPDANATGTHTDLRLTDGGRVFVLTIVKPDRTASDGSSMMTVVERYVRLTSGHMSSSSHADTIADASTSFSASLRRPRRDHRRRGEHATIWRIIEVVWRMFSQFTLDETEYITGPSLETDWHLLWRVVLRGVATMVSTSEDGHSLTVVAYNSVDDQEVSHQKLAVFPYEGIHTWIEVATTIEAIWLLDRRPAPPLDLRIAYQSLYDPPSPLVCAAYMSIQQRLYYLNTTSTTSLPMHAFKCPILTSVTQNVIDIPGNLPLATLSIRCGVILYSLDGDIRIFRTFVLTPLVHSSSTASGAASDRHQHPTTAPSTMWKIGPMGPYGRATSQHPTNQMRYGDTVAVHIRSPHCPVPVTATVSDTNIIAVRRGSKVRVSGRPYGVFMDISSYAIDDKSVPSSLSFQHAETFGRFLLSKRSGYLLNLASEFPFQRRVSFDGLLRSGAVVCGSVVVMLQAPNVSPSVVTFARDASVLSSSMEDAASYVSYAASPIASGDSDHEPSRHPLRFNDNYFIADEFFHGRVGDISRIVEISSDGDYCVILIDGELLTLSKSLSSSDDLITSFITSSTMDVGRTDEDGAITQWKLSLLVEPPPGCRDRLVMSAMFLPDGHPVSSAADGNNGIVSTPRSIVVVYEGGVIATFDLTSTNPESMVRFFLVSRWQLIIACVVLTAWTLYSMWNEFYYRRRRADAS